MKFIPILLLSVFWVTAAGQKSLKIDTTSEAITWNGVSVNQEGAYVLETKAKILRYDADPDRNMVYIQTHTGTEQKPSRKGKLLAYDASADKIRWSKTMNYRRDNFVLIDSVPILYQNSSSTAFRWDTGKMLWERDDQIMLSADSERLVIGFSPNYDTHNRILALNPHTGQTIWEEKPNVEVQLEYADFLSDTAIVCINQGLHYINFRNGKNFFQEQEMAMVNQISEGEYFLVGFFGGLLGVLITSAMHSSYSAVPAVGNLQKAYVYHKKNMYSIHKDQLRKYNMEGNIVWSVDCLYYTGSPKLFVHNEDLYAVQGGVKYKFDGRAVYGTMGITRVGTSLGDVKKVQKLSNIKKDFMRDYIVKDSTIVVATNSRIAEFCIRDFKELKVNDFGGGNKKLGFSKILNPPAYVEEEGKFRNATKENPNHFYTTNTADQKIEFDGDFEMVSVVRKRNFFQERVTFPSGLKCLENEYKVVFVEEDNQQVGDIFFTPNMQIEKDYILDRTENQILFLPDEAIGGFQ